MKLHAFENAGSQEGIAASGDIQIFPVGERHSCQWGQLLSFLKMEIVPSFMEKVADESGLGKLFMRTTGLTPLQYSNQTR
ncbi:hypothetical protein [Paenibacillus sp. OSY-SE]|uniref:hypothetical protein n=1 Tax=Paenibacillus sp. OSY-SE TaxID=1196323 RepID=UPI0002E46198|nr:hypothetical protein [Paenibacillus sp. OSY-SE]